MNEQSKNASDSLLNNDRFVACMLNNIETARHFFRFVLPTKLSELLDFNTLQNERTRLTSPSGKDQYGDFFFTCNLRDPSKKSVRRPLFTIILEHKSQDESEVAIQLAGYVIGLIQQMWSNRDKYADADGKLPAPYAIVLSQDWGAKRIYSLKDLLRAIPGFEDTIPNFSFQYFRVCDSPIEEIAKCEELTALFIYLLRLLNDKSVNVDEETTILAERLGDCLKIENPSERIREGLEICFSYLDYIQARRPQTPRLEEVFEKMETSDFRLSEAVLAQKCMPKYWKKMETRIQEAEARANSAKERADNAETENIALKAKNKALKRAATIGLKVDLAHYLDDRFPSEERKRLNSLVDSVNEYETLDVVYDICMKCQSIDEMTDSVERFLGLQG